MKSLCKVFSPATPIVKPLSSAAPVAYRDILQGISHTRARRFPFAGGDQPFYRYLGTNCAVADPLKLRSLIHTTVKPL